MTAASPADEPAPTYRFQILLDQAPTDQQAAALRRACPEDRLQLAGRLALLQCARQAESLPAAIADTFDQVWQACGLGPLWVEIDGAEPGPHALPQGQAGSS